MCDGWHVTELLLADRDLELSSLPHELTGLAGLRLLDLSGNRVQGTIPAALSSLSCLQALSLSGNNLTGTIPPQMSAMSLLRVLDLSHNRLTGTIPSELVALSRLEVLTLRDNDLRGPFPDTFTSLGGVLKELDLANNCELCGSNSRVLGALYASLKNFNHDGTHIWTGCYLMQHRCHQIGTAGIITSDPMAFRVKVQESLPLPFSTQFLPLSSPDVAHRTLSPRPFIPLALSRVLQLPVTFPSAQSIAPYRRETLAAALLLWCQVVVTSMALVMLGALITITLSHVRPPCIYGNGQPTTNSQRDEVELTAAALEVQGHAASNLQEPSESNSLSLKRHTSVGAVIINPGSTIQSPNICVAVMDSGSLPQLHHAPFMADPRARQPHSQQQVQDEVRRPPGEPGQGEQDMEAPALRPVQSMPPSSLPGHRDSLGWMSWHRALQSLWRNPPQQQGEGRRSLTMTPASSSDYGGMIFM